jgi:hypothetical protein
MDADANLQEQEQIILVGFSRVLTESERTRLNELRTLLADWLIGGGAEPDWSSAPRAAMYYGH